jgi:phosphoribosylglycinamide formyltransferase-1
MVKCAVFASGRGTNFENLVTSEIPNLDIVLLVTDQICRALEIASRNRIEAKSFIRQDYLSRRAMEEHIAALLDERGIQLIVLAGYMRLLSPWFVHRYHERIINIHPSLLPHYKGKHAIEQAYSDGKDIYGVSIHYVNEGMDEGEIIAQSRIHYDGTDLAELEQLVHETEYRLYPQVIREICSQRRFT